MKEEQMDKDRVRMATRRTATRTWKAAHVQIVLRYTTVVDVSVVIPQSLVEGGVVGERRGE